MYTGEKSYAERFEEGKKHFARKLLFFCFLSFVFDYNIKRFLRSTYTVYYEKQTQTLSILYLFIYILGKFVCKNNNGSRRDYYNAT